MKLRSLKKLLFQRSHPEEGRKSRRRISYRNTATCDFEGFYNGLKFLKYMKRKAFALPEIIAGALIVTISAAGTYSVYIVARQFSKRFEHKSMATNRAAQIADRLRYRFSYDNPGTDPLAVGLYNSDNDPAGLLDVSGWQLNNEVNDLEAEYTVANVWFNGGEEVAANPGTGTPAFKKVVVRIRWNERL